MTKVKLVYSIIFVVLICIYITQDSFIDKLGFLENEFSWNARNNKTKKNFQIVKKEIRSRDPIYGKYSNDNYCPFSVSIPSGFKGFLYAPPPAPNHGFFVPLENSNSNLSNEDCNYEKGHFMFVDVALYAVTENERNFDKVIKKDIEYTVSGLKDLDIEVKLVSLQNFSINKSVAKKIIFTYKSNLTSQKMIFDKLVIIGQTKEGTVSCIFSLGLVTPELNYKEYMPLFDHMISSWYETKEE
ncbi:MAG: hypothetical protein WAQ98_30415 [Blastocatellia bacterium]